MTFVENICNIAIVFNILNSPGPIVNAPDPGTGGTTYTGKDKKTYYYQGPNWDVGDWLYLVLGLFGQSLPAASATICSVIAGTAASVLSNRNKGNGVIIRVYSGGSAIYSR